MTLDDMIFTFMDLPLEPKEVQDHGTVKEELPKNAKKRGKGACQMESLSVSKERLGLQTSLQEFMKQENLQTPSVPQYKLPDREADQTEQININKL